MWEGVCKLVSVRIKPWSWYENNKENKLNCLEAWTKDRTLIVPIRKILEKLSSRSNCEGEISKQWLKEGEVKVRISVSGTLSSGGWGQDPGHHIYNSHLSFSKFNQN